MAWKAWPLTTASTASTGGALPAIGSGRWAVTAGQWLAEVAEPALATVYHGQWPRLWRGTRQKAPVVRQLSRPVPQQFLPRQRPVGGGKPAAGSAVRRLLL